MKFYHEKKNAKVPSFIDLGILGFFNKNINSQSTHSLNYIYGIY